MIERIVIPLGKILQKFPPTAGEYESIQQVWLDLTDGKDSLIVELEVNPDKAGLKEQIKALPTARSSMIDGEFVDVKAVLDVIDAWFANLPD